MVEVWLLRKFCSVPGRFFTQQLAAPTQPLRAGPGHATMKTLLLPTLLAAGALLAAPARAQRAFRVGPTAGAALSTIHFTDVSDNTTLPLRGGWLAGATGSYQSAGHWGAQLAVLYTRQGYIERYEYNAYQYSNNVRLNYLRVPLQATFSQHAGGQGLQVFAGPYVGVLLGGRHTYESSSGGSSYTSSAPVEVADLHTQPAYILYDYSATSLVAPTRIVAPDYTGYSRRFDVGLQGGVGYRLGNALLQVGYTLGLRNLATTNVYELSTYTYRSAGEPYRTRGLQASLTYLLGPKS